MEDNLNYDLEDKINIIYDYLYNTNTKNCFSFDKLQLGKIGLGDIKIDMPIDSNQDEINIYQKNLQDILDGKFKLLSYDENTHQIFLKKYSNQFSVSVKVSFYENTEKINSFNDSVNNDSLFSYVLSQLVLSNKTRHILLPIINLDTKFSEIEKFTYDDISNQKIKSAILNGNITDSCCLQLREHFFKTVNLEEYLKENKCAYKPLLFQIIHTLAVMQKEFEGFRHNNLLLKNILIYLKRPSETYSEYDGFKGDKFYLPNPGFDIKITNFEHSIIPKFYGLHNSKNSKIKFADQPNSYYDIFVFLNDLLEGVTLMSSYSETKCDMETKKFLDKVIPPHIRGLDYKNFNKNYVIVSPLDLLYDSYFEEYKNKPSKKSEETIANNQYYTNKIDTFMDSDNYSVLGNQDKIISSSNIMMKKTSTRKIKTDNNETSKKGGSKKILEDIDEEGVNTRIIKIDQNDQKIYRKQKNEIVESYDNELYGGADKPELAPYKAEKNTTFISNDQRETFKKRAAENPIIEPPVILEQKVYDVSKKPAPKPQFPPTFIPLYGQEGDGVVNQLLPYSQVVNQPPVQKVYNVSLTNPLQGTTSLNRIYEDVLPSDQFGFTSISVYERSQLIDFLRNNILEYGDGEEMTITGGKNSLLSHIKVLDVNPYTVKKNPYVDLARNFLLYRAGYPVRFDDRNKIINLGKNSMGLNIRMYMMTVGDLKCKTINNHINSDNFDLWREVKYYDFVKNEIIKKKLSPNFIAPVLYKIDSQSKIEWDKLEMIKNKGYSNDTIKELKENQQKINKDHKLVKELGLFQQLLPMQFRRQLTLSVVKDKTDKKTDEIKPEDKEDLSQNSGKVLILLTEAPTTNFIQWSSTIYESFGTVKKMISTGYHTPDVWKSVLFQLVYAFAVLQEKEIYMKNLSLENNFYIKDIFSDANAVGSWIYKSDNIEYYVPNYGYILMFDSKYCDVETSQSLIKKNISDKQIFKINGSIFKTNGLHDGDAFRTVIYNQFKSIIDPDNFGHSFKVKGGSVPDESIINLLKAMFSNTSLKQIRDYLPEYFGEFLHNRIGTLLLKSEKDMISPLSKPKFNKGNLMAFQKRFSEYEWVVYLGDSGDGLRKKIIRKVGDNFVHEDVFTSTLFSYPENDKILPNSSKNFRYDEHHIYETYSLDG